MKERGRICLKSFSWKTVQSKWKSLNRTDWLVVMLLGVLLLVIAIPTGSAQKSEAGGDSADSSGNALTGQSEGTQKNADESAETDGDADSQAEFMSAYKKQLESELASLLSQMDGVGQVQVMLTLKDSGADVLDKNVKRDGDASETDTVVYSGEDGEAPYVTNRFAPDVAGVFIVAEGGGNAVIVSDISEAVMALFGIEAHKIKVVKMS
jgi:stage III sporulation protein AG